MNGMHQRHSDNGEVRRNTSIHDQIQMWLNLAYGNNTKYY